MNSKSITSFGAPELIELIREHVEAEEIDKSQSLIALGCDSMSALEIAETLESDFDRVVSVDDLLDCEDFESLFRLIQESPEVGDSPDCSGVPEAPGHSSGHVSLTAFQERLWALDQLEPGSCQFNSPKLIQFSGRPSLNSLTAALERVAATHPILTATVRNENDSPVLELSRSQISISIETIAASAASESPAARVEVLAKAACARPFDLETGPLARFVYYTHSSDLSWLLVDIHHLAFDGFSFRNFCRLLGDSLLHPERKNVQNVQFQECVAVLRDYARSEQHRIDKEFWGSRLRGSSTLLNLPLDRPWQTGATGALHKRILPDPLKERLEEFSSRHSVTPFSVFSGAFSILLARLTGQKDFMLGYPVACRNRAGFGEVIGPLMNTLLMRIRTRPDMTFIDHVEDLSLQIREGFGHLQYPFSDLAKDLRGHQQLTRHPLTQAFIQLMKRENYSQYFPFPVSIVNFDTGLVLSDLELVIWEVDGRYELCMYYDANIFLEDTVQGMVDQYEWYLEALLAEPDRSLSEISSNKRQVATELLPSITDSYWRQSESTAEIFFAQDGSRLTREHLWQRVDEVAKALSANYPSGSAIGVCISRNSNWLICWLAIWQAGCVYVPLDTSYPPSRLKENTDDANLACILIEGDKPNPLAGTEVQIHSIEELEGAGDSDFQSAYTTAYILFTSGSTGRSKGVLGTHRATQNRLQWLEDAFPTSKDDVYLSRASIGFVDSIWETLGPISQGSKLVVTDSVSVLDPATFTALMNEHRVTRTLFVPSVLESLIDMAPDIGERIPDLRICFVSGERVSTNLATRFFRSFPHCRLVNLYGTTESGGDSFYHEVLKSDLDRMHIPIGLPIRETSFKVVDDYGHHSEVLEAGELWISGACLSDGYLSSVAEVGAESAFITQEDGTRWYRTGDYARQRIDGSLEYLGRKDRQVKVNGVRIELQEIERVLVESESVAKAIAAKNPFTNKISAWIVSEDGEESSRRALEYARQRLPRLYWPASVTTLETFPLGPSGKVDLDSLFQLENSSDEPTILESSTPMTDTEHLVAEIWQEIFHIDTIQPSDDFFELGGDSVDAVKMLTEIERKIGSPPSTSLLVTHSSLSEFSAALTNPQSFSGTQANNIHLDTDQTQFIYMGGISDEMFWVKNIHKQMRGNSSQIILRSPLEDEELTGLSVSDLIDSYLKELSKFTLAKKVVLVGFSFGGLLAYALAQRLSAKGGISVFFICLDGYSIVYSPRYRNKVRAKRLLRKLVKPGLFSQLVKKDRPGNSPNNAVYNERSFLRREQRRFAGEYVYDRPDFEGLVVYTDECNRVMNHVDCWKNLFGKKVVPTHLLDVGHVDLVTTNVQETAALMAEKLSQWPND